MINFLKRYRLTKIGLDLFMKYKDVILYLFFGGVTTLVNIVIYALFTKVFNIDYMVSNIIAWTIAVAVAYITNKIYVFESKTTTKKELLKEVSSFLTARILSLVIDVVVMYVGISLLHFNDMLIKIIANVIVIVANYFMSKYFIFKNTKKN